MTRSHSFILAVASVLVVVLGYFYFANMPAPGVMQIGAPFHLASSKGGTVTSSSLEGAPYGVFFGFTHCPEVCPTTLYEMAAALDDLGDDAKAFRLFFITVDPERDTTKDLGDYMSSFDPRMEGLVPTLSQLPELAKSFHVLYEKVPTSDGGYTMNHTATIYLFDKSGRFASTISYGEAKAVRVAKIRKLL